MDNDKVSALQAVIDRAFKERHSLSAATVSSPVSQAVISAIAGLESGELRVAEKKCGTWCVNEWLKKAVLLYLRIAEKKMISGFAQFYDQIPLKFRDKTPEELRHYGIRIVPPATARAGCYIAPNTVLMPSFVNIGAYVDTGTLIDTWSTVGSCAQIGKNVHISGGTGIGGVLEPLQAQPTIIEDHCFIGARCEIAEGVIVEEGSVIGMGVLLGQSTKIYHRATGKISYGRIPAGSVVVAGSLPGRDNQHHLYCAVIVKEVDEKTRSKTQLNDLLRSVD